MIPENISPRTVSVIDDDESIRDAIRSLLRSCGYRVEAFASAEDFLNSGDLGHTACLIVDVQMPDMNGLDLQRQFVEAKRQIPILFITAHDDDAARERALEAGTLAFLRKPFQEQALMDALRSAFAGRAGRHLPGP